MRIATIVAFVVILVLLYLLSNRPSGARQELERQEARYLKSMDSLSDVNTGLRLKDSLLVVSLRVKKDSLSIALKRASNQTIRYVEIKPLISPTDHQLDSALSALYPRFTPILRGS